MSSEEQVPVKKQRSRGVYYVIFTNDLGRLVMQEFTTIDLARNYANSLVNSSYEVIFGRRLRKETVVKF